MTPLERAALLKIRCASRHRQGHRSIAYARANTPTDHVHEKTAMRVPTSDTVLALLVQNGLAADEGEGLVITEKGIEALEATLDMQPTIAWWAKSQPPPAATPKTSARWECQGCGALNPDRRGPCVGCKLSAPKRTEIL